MSTTDPNFTKTGFAKTFILPALLIFLVPLIGLLFFSYAQAHYDAIALEGIIKQINEDKSMTDQQKAESIAFFQATPFSDLVLNDQFAANVDSQVLFDLSTFRWMIRLSLFSLLGGLSVFLFAAVCVWLSLRSQQMQYLSLVSSWHILRLYGAAQTIIIGTLLIALSYWVTALIFNIYVPKLILIAAICSLIGVGLVLRSIFTNPKQEFVLEGTVLDRDEALPLWDKLHAICDKVGANPPDQIIAGIDDNFFVTELPVTVEGQKYYGKTLFVSLPLLKQLRTAEADAVLAHEMAHFSGNDTLYSKRIAPLLQRYQGYLQSLYEGGISLPVYYYMLCFRVLFELSLSKLRRDREFRADQIAAEITSPRDFAAGLLRTVAYSKFRQSVEWDLFKQHEAMEKVDVSQRIENGFPAYAVSMATETDMENLETAHPFDSHPPLSQRFNAIGLDVASYETHELLATPGDGGWYHHITAAEDLERQQWSVYEERFRTAHEESLPYRFLPSNEHELEIVVRAFPPITFEGKTGSLVMDYEKITLPAWPDPLRYEHISNCTLDDAQVLQLHIHGTANRSRLITTRNYTQPEMLLATFQRYYGRYLAAVEFQKVHGAALAAEAAEQAQRTEASET